MDNLWIARAKRVGIRTPKNEKARAENGLENQTNLAPDYNPAKPKKLSTARLSSYWVAMMGVQKNG
ncbi:MAG: hypothetical protein E6Q83_20080 [Thiothrix sp.]|nr:MAG: hypothetical protein E6Q83_20080 [Thiothrix sp.]